MYRKILILTLSLTLLVLAAVGGTLTWLQAKTDPITNTFVAGDIKLELKENTGNEYKMVPGAEIAKDPRVIVKAGSEKCYVFVKLEKTANFDDFMTFEIVSDWKALPGYSDIYYQVVEAVPADKVDADLPTLYILNGNKVIVNSEATKEQFNALTAETQPKLTVTAYAVQYETFETGAVYAWDATFGKDATPETTTPETTTPDA